MIAVVFIPRTIVYIATLGVVNYLDSEIGDGSINGADLALAAGADALTRFLYLTCRRRLNLYGTTAGLGDGVITSGGRHVGK